MCAVITVISFGLLLSEIVVVICSYACKCPINPLPNPEPDSGHTVMLDNILNLMPKGSSEVSLSIYQNAWLNTPKVSNLHRHSRQNLRYNVDNRSSSFNNLVDELCLVSRIVRSQYHASAVRHCLLSNVGDISTRCNIVYYLSQDVDIKDSHLVRFFLSLSPFLRI
jgi:hypothetical protein